jgi:hypothetical protein
MKDEAGRPQSEMDVLKFYIWLMVVMTLALAGFFWKIWSDLDRTTTNLKVGQTSAKDFAERGAEIQAMLGVYKNSKEDEARDSPNTWFARVWSRRGINGLSIVPTTWKVPPDYNAKGKFSEERIDMGFNSKAPLTREQIAEFCHEIEKSSTRLRVIELEVRRAEKDKFDSDEWAGKAIVGYRHTPEKPD